MSVNMVVNRIPALVTEEEEGRQAGGLSYLAYQ